MRISELFIRVVILVLPGLIGSLFYRKLRGGRQQKDWRDLAEISLFALSSYAVCGAILEFVYWGQDRPLIALQALLDASVPIRWLEILAASVVSVVLSILVSYTHRYKLINRFGRSISATKRYGDEDVWEYLFNSPNFGNWVFIRDHKVDLVYYGWVESYSESGEERELLLTLVEVYSNDEETNAPLYRVATMYMSRNADDVTIEIPSPQEPDEVSNDVQSE